MKKLLSYIGIVTMICLSIVISEKTTTVVKEIDQIMIQIRENKTKYEIEPINAIIKNNTIVPGIYGKKINIEQTYNEMKKVGTYNSKYIVYESIKPELSLEQNYDKYIIKGNPKKNAVSIILKINEEDDINYIIEILKKHDLKVTFLINNNLINNKKQLTVNIINQGHSIINNEQLMQDINSDQILNYCYIEQENEEILKKCKISKKYTIKPNIVVNSNSIKEIKKKLESGSIIAIPINTIKKGELDVIINHIKSKGYKIEDLQNHLSEKNNN